MSLGRLFKLLNAGKRGDVQLNFAPPQAAAERGWGENEQTMLLETVMNKPWFMQKAIKRWGGKAASGGGIRL